MRTVRKSQQSCALMPSHADAGLEYPYLFAYDITGPRRARLIRQCLQRWCLDGQLSLHEIRLPPWKLQELAVELLELADGSEDKLLVARLSQRGHGPVLTFGGNSRQRAVATLGAAAPRPVALANGWHLIAYDITNPRRLQRFQRQAARIAAQLQRSVYLFQGRGTALQRALPALMDHFCPHADDLRLYPLAGPEHLWFLCGTSPSLAGMNTIPTGSHVIALRHEFPKKKGCMTWVQRH